MRASNWVVYVWVEVLLRKSIRETDLSNVPVPPLFLATLMTLLISGWSVQNSSLVKANCPKKLLFPNWGET